MTIKDTSAHLRTLGVALVSFEEIIDANKAIGHMWFSEGAMRFFDSKLEGRSGMRGPGGTFFVSSEQFHGSTGSLPRRWGVRFVESTGAIFSLDGKFDQPDAALYLCLQLAAGVVEDRAIPRVSGGGIARDCH